MRAPSLLNKCPCFCGGVSRVLSLLFWGFETQHIAGNKVNLAHIRWESSWVASVLWNSCKCCFGWVNLVADAGFFVWLLYLIFFMCNPKSLRSRLSYLLRFSSQYSIGFRVTEIGHWFDVGMVMLICCYFRQQQKCNSQSSMTLLCFASRSLPLSFNLLSVLDLFLLSGRSY